MRPLAAKNEKHKKESQHPPDNLALAEAHLSRRLRPKIVE